MTDKNKEDHQPVLNPVDDKGSAKVKKAKAKQGEPELLSEGGREIVKPPYLLFALILFGLLGMFWKMVVRKDEPAAISYEQRLEDAKNEQEQRLKEFQKSRGRNIR